MNHPTYDFYNKPHLRADALADENQKQTLIEECKSALNAPPNKAGTLHGIVRVHLGCIGRKTSLFPSRKNGGAIPLRSRAELSYAVMLERDVHVER